jgi:hypothetical protein
MSPFAVASRGRMIVAVGAAFAGIVAAGAAASVAGEGPSAVLDLPGGGTLPGVIQPAPPSADGGRATLAWQSPLFSQPLEFYLDQIVGVRFTRLAQPPAGATFRFLLRGGDMLDGDLESIDAERVVMRLRGTTASVCIRRGVIEGLSRLGGVVAGTYVGPGGLMGWEHAAGDGWREEAGRIATSRPGAALLDLGAAPRACYDVVLSWRRRPELRLSVAAATKPRDDPYAVELVRLQDGSVDAAVVRQEVETAAIEPLETGDPKIRTLRIVIFVDQEQGRLAAFTVADGVAGPVADVTLAAAADRQPSGRFRITVGSGDVCLESLRVSPWTMAEPTIDDRPLTRLITRDGRVLEAEVESFDAETGELVLAKASGAVRMKLDDVGEIIMPRHAADEPVADGHGASLRAVLASGCTVAGELVAIERDAVRLRVAGIDDPLSLPLADLVSLTALTTRDPAREIPGRVGTLLAEGVALKGCVVGGVDESPGIAWWPLGAVGPSPLAAGGEAAADMVIEYVPRPSREPVGGSQVEVGGIGGMVNQDADGLFVVTMLSEDGAAAMDGRLQPGDRLLAIRPRAEGGFVPTKGHDVQTIMNLLRGRVGSPVVLRVAADGGDPRDIDLKRGMIYVAGREVLEQALAAHARLAPPEVSPAEGGDRSPSLIILRSGDVVPCEVVSIDGESMRVRTPVADGAGTDPVVVPAGLIQAVELDPAVPSRGIDKARLERLLMLPRSQRLAPPTHMIRLRDGDYLRGRLESLDGETLVVDVRGEAKTLTRSEIARVIWLHPEERGTKDDAGPAAVDAGTGEASGADEAAGLVVQGVAAGRRVTLVAERVADECLYGTSPALGPGRIDLRAVDRLLVGRAIDREADELPYRQWKLRPAPEPRQP